MAAAYEPPVSDYRGELVIRPSWRALGRWEIQVAGLMLSMVVVGGLGLLAEYRSVGPVVELVGIGALILAQNGLYLAAYMISTRITVTADAILVTHWFRSTARVARSDIARVERTSLTGGVKLAFTRVPWSARSWSKIFLSSSPAPSRVDRTATVPDSGPGSSEAGGLIP